MCSSPTCTTCQKLVSPDAGGSQREITVTDTAPIATKVMHVHWEIVAPHYCNALPLTYIHVFISFAPVLSICDMPIVCGQCILSTIRSVPNCNPCTFTYRAFLRGSAYLRSGWRHPSQPTYALRSRRHTSQPAYGVRSTRHTSQPAYGVRSTTQMILCAMLLCNIAHSIICTRLFRGKMHSDWFNGIEIPQGRW